MKLRMTTLAIAAALTLTACSISNDDSDDRTNISTDTSSDSIIRQEVKYIKHKQYIDYEPYHTIEDAISDGDIVVVGEVTNISFMTHADMSDPPPEIKEDKVLCTVYDLNISNVYKGKAGDSVKLKIGGGVENEAYTDEQLSLLGDQPFPTIMISAFESTFEIGQKYLLILYEFQAFAGYYHPVGYGEGIYPVNSTSEILKESDIPFVYSVKDVISYFGEEQWEAFKSDNNITTE